MYSPLGWDEAIVGVLTRGRRGRARLQGSQNRKEWSKGLPLGKYPWRRHFNIVSINILDQVYLRSWTLMHDEYLHQQAGLTAGTVAYNDKLSTDFRHRDGREMEKM
jgi:hypothetical protein